MTETRPADVTDTWDAGGVGTRANGSACLEAFAFCCNVAGICLGLGVVPCKSFADLSQLAG